MHYPFKARLQLGLIAILSACVPSIDTSKNGASSQGGNLDVNDEEPSVEEPSDEPANEPSADEPSDEPADEPALPSYAGGYPVNPCNPAPQGNGYAVGSVAYDFSLMDQYGEMLTLSDFCGSVILLESSAFW